MSRHSFTRKELYDLVWSEPMRKLCKTLGISDRGLAKACARANIPVPPRGYWARKDAGQDVPVDSLPVLKDGERDQLTIDPPPVFVKPPEPPPHLSVQDALAAELASAKPITVPASLRDPHPIIADWIEEDRRDAAEAKRSSMARYFYDPLQGNELDRRRLRIFNTLIRALEARGYKVAAQQYRSWPIHVFKDSEKLELSLYEYIRQQRRQLTDAEKKDHWDKNRRWRQEKIPTGTLMLRIKSTTWYHRKDWHETADDLLDGHLNEVLGWVAATYEQLRLRREEQAEQQRRYQEEQRRRQRAEEERQREQIRVERLVGSAAQWRSVADIRALVAAVQAAPAEERDCKDEAAWIQWALATADRLDPLLNRSTSTIAESLMLTWTRTTRWSRGSRTESHKIGYVI